MDEGLEPPRSGPATGATGPASDLDDPAPALASFDPVLIFAAVCGGAALLQLLLGLGPADLLIALVAVVLGHIGLRRVRTSRERGRAAGVFALVSGYAAIALVVVLIIAALGAAPATSGPGDPPAACVSATGHFSKAQLQRCAQESVP